MPENPALSSTHLQSNTSWVSSLAQLCLHAGKAPSLMCHQCWRNKVTPLKREENKQWQTIQSVIGCYSFVYSEVGVCQCFLCCNFAAGNLVLKAKAQLILLTGLAQKLAEGQSISFTWYVMKWAFLSGSRFNKNSDDHSSVTKMKSCLIFFRLCTAVSSINCSE